jgi:hypothetical protein
MTSLRACATCAAAVLPSIVTILRDGVVLAIQFLLASSRKRSQAFTVEAKLVSIITSTWDEVRKRGE